MKLVETKVVYVIKNIETGRVKIGISKNPKSRLLALISASGCKLELMYHTDYIEDAIGLESKMHNTFSDYRYLGEWFDLDWRVAVNQLGLYAKTYKLCEVVTMFNDGRNPTYIAKKLGVSRTAIVFNLRTKGFFVKREKAQSKKEFNREKNKPSNIYAKSNKLNIAEMVRINNEKIKAKRFSRR